MSKESILIALGGNAISIQGEEGNIKQQFFHTSEAVQEIVNLIKLVDCNLILTHGNGPQVGNVILRSELAAKVLYTLPIDICVSDTEGGMGYMIQQVMHNKLIENRINRNVVSIITQVLVDINDENFKNPTKPIGRFYTQEEAEALQGEKKWTMVEDSGRGYRRIIASPKPIRIIEEKIIKTLAESGIIVIAAGGGGIPVVEDKGGKVYGIEAIIDKDLASSLLAQSINVETLIILTSVEKVCINFGKKNQMTLDRVTVSELENYVQEGHFAPGSMLPKIIASIEFLKNGGERVIIAKNGCLLDAYREKTGTHITI